MKQLLICLFCLSGASPAQVWSGVLNPTYGAGACNTTSTASPGKCAIDWSTAGVPIPTNRTQCGSSITSTGSDQTAALNSALSSCASSHPLSGAGGYVLLAAGTFVIHGTVTIPSNVTLRGSGAQSTILSSTNTNNAPISMGSGGPNCAWSNGYCSYPHQTPVTAGYQVGSATLTVGSSSGISAGMYLMIDQVNDGAFVTNYGGQGTCGGRCDAWRTADGTRAQAQIVEVETVDREANTIQISPPLFNTYARSPVVVYFSSLKYAGLENLQTYANNTHSSTATEASNVLMSGCAYCWIKGIEGNFTDGDHVRVWFGFRDSIVDSYFSNAFLHGAGNYDSDIMLADRTTLSLVQNNILERLHTSVLVEWGAAGNVIAYNYMWGNFDSSVRTYVMVELGTHGGHPQFNLYEGNVGTSLNPDSIWGSTANNTALRNWEMGTTQACTPYSGRGTLDCSGSNGPYETAGSADVSITYLNQDWNLIGNVLGSPAQTELENNVAQAWAVCGVGTPCGTNSRNNSHTYGYTWGYTTIGDNGGRTGDTLQVYNNALIHGNYNNIDSSLVWASGITHALAASFYRSARPSWWGSTIPWPAIGPDVTGGGGPGGHTYSLTASNPAQACYNSSPKLADGSLAFDPDSCYGTSGPGGTPSRPPTGVTAP